jgi:hypothetical protein
MNGPPGKKIKNKCLVQIDYSDKSFPVFVYFKIFNLATDQDQFRL